MATITSIDPGVRTDTKRLRRTTGALCGALIILLGLWGALVPFVGPYFHYAFGSFHTWHYSSARLWLDILPGVFAVIGGLLLVFSSTRTGGLIGGWLAVAAGVWFAIGPAISLLWHAAGDPIGAPMGGHTRQAFELLGYFQGLGVVIVALGAFAMGRYFSRPRVAEQSAVAAGGPLAAAEPPVAAREQPAVARDEPAVARDEPAVARQDPVASSARPQAEGAPAARETATARGEQAVGASTPAPTATERRRPGLLRFRRR
jgi:hypothetical protein